MWIAICHLLTYFLVSDLLLATTLHTGLRGNKSVEMYPVKSCPGDADSWLKAGINLKCPNDTIGRNLYQCAPKDDKTDLVEFCLKGSIGRYEEGLCVYAYPSGHLDVEGCEKFLSGCPEKSYISDEIYNYPACLKINREAGCYLADPACPPIDRPTVERVTNASIISFTSSSEQEMDERSSGSVNGSRRVATSNSLPTPAIVGIIIGIVIVLSVVIATLLYKRRNRGGKQKNLESGEEDLEKMSQTGTKKGVENEEGDVNEIRTLLGKGSPEDTDELPTGSSLVYVVEGPEQREQDQVPGGDRFVRILVVVLMASISEGKLMSEAQKIFGPNCKLLSVSCYQEQSKEKYETLFTEDFNVKDANLLQFFEKLREVVTVNKQDANFVVGVPFSIWTKQRDDIVSMFEKDYDLVLKSVYYVENT